MLVYYIILLLGIFFYSKKNKYYISIFTLVILILGLVRSSDVGTDYSSYINTFNFTTYYDYKVEFTSILNYILLQTEEKKIIEPFWTALNSFIYSNGGTYFYVNLIALGLIISLYTFTIKKRSINPNFSIFLLYALFFYFASFNIVRQAIAISFIFCSYYFFENKKYLLGVSLYTLASLFHFTAIFGIFPILLFIIPPFKIRVKTALFTLLITLIFGISISELITKEIVISNIYSGYIENKLGTTDIIISYINYIGQFILFYIVVRDKKQSVISDKFAQVWLFGLILQNLFIGITFFSRFIDYFLIAQIIAIPYYMSSNHTLIDNKKNFIIVIVVIISFTINLYFNKQGIFPFSLY